MLYGCVCMCVNIYVVWQGVCGVTKEYVNDGSESHGLQNTFNMKHEIPVNDEND